MINVFVGYDSKVPVLSNVLQHSINRRSSQPVSITRISLAQLDGVFSRDVSALASTEFSFSRFLVPYLSGYVGWSLFLDNDMVMLADIAELWALRNDQYSVMATQHDHTPVDNFKFLGAVQTKYDKKNWSSCMLFNNEKCRQLTPEYVNTASGLELHQFKWLDSDRQIGSIPLEWNYLADNTVPKLARGDIKLIHYTDGGPYFTEYSGCEHGNIWTEELADSQRCAQKAAS